jgi:adenosylcobalamin-dependent ribonucleoside-triphosphate reductase
LTNQVPDYTPSPRAEIITRRTYNRPLDAEGKVFETWEQTVDRVIWHQEWLWRRALGNKKWRPRHSAELDELRELFRSRKALPAGRTLWLGGTVVGQSREASMFNCSFLRVETVHDIVDSFWLLLQGCGVGFEPVVGTLSGFSRPTEVEIIRSTKTDVNDKGYEHNVEQFHQFRNTEDNYGYHWVLKVGDSAEAWAKAAGKLLANKRHCEKLTLDFSEIRPAGVRLKGYGWISSGDETISKAFEQICIVLNKKASRLLSRIDILDIMNHLGTTLSSRRSAEIAVVPYGDPEWVEFAKAKKDHWIDNPQRSQSNNSLVFYHRPSKSELTDIFSLMVESGGSEPGFINGQAALLRAPWFKGVNPCAEILLANKSFCNLVEIDLAKFNGDWDGLIRATELVARANYRQTCVNLDDGILQRSWHELNEFLRLTGVGLTGIVRWEHHDDYQKLRTLRGVAQRATYIMADEVIMPRSKCVTTIKPSGTLSKIMDTTEGIHKPLGRYIFNNVRFAATDPLLGLLSDSGYYTFADPYNPDAVLVRFPVDWGDLGFSDVDGKEVNLESAVDQLNRYKFYMENYVTHNASITVSYDPAEVPDIVDWIYGNWDHYVGVSFLFRADPTKTAEDLGYPYLPQEVVSREVFEAYASTLKPVSLVNSFDEILDDDCATGACPIK